MQPGRVASELDIVHLRQAKPHAYSVGGYTGKMLHCGSDAAKAERAPTICLLQACARYCSGQEAAGSSYLVTLKVAVVVADTFSGWS